MPYISTRVDRDDTWKTTEDLTGEDGTEVSTCTRICFLTGAEYRSGRRLAISRIWLILFIHLVSANPTDDGEWSAREHRTLLDAVRPGEHFHQLGVYADIRGDCRKQLGHIKKRVEYGMACLIARGSAKFAEALLVANATALKQTECGLQFTAI